MHDKTRAALLVKTAAIDATKGKFLSFGIMATEAILGLALAAQIVSPFSSAQSYTSVAPEEPNFQP